LPVHQSKRASLTAILLVLSLSVGGCANSQLAFNPLKAELDACTNAKAIVNVEQAKLFREAETERATHLMKEIARLQADLKTAEAALVEAESGLSANHTRADAVSSLAITRIQVERAESRAPWRADEIQGARSKLDEAERQVEENRFGAALFFVYRARRVAESILDEAQVVESDGNVQLILAPRVNLRSGPSKTESILSVLTYGTPVFPQTNEGDWLLVQVSGGPVGWIYRQLVGPPFSTEIDGPAAPRP
jgi:hypothetical protein